MFLSLPSEVQQRSVTLLYSIMSILLGILTTSELNLLQNMLFYIRVHPSLQTHHETLRLLLSFRGQMKTDESFNKVYGLLYIG